MSTKVVAVLNQKGGSGKTTLSTHLARALTLAGAKVLLVDSDPQGSARDWHAAADGELVPVVGLDRPTLEKDIPAIAGSYEWIFVDGAPSRNALALSALKAADIVLIPVQPSPYDIWATAELVDSVKQRQDLTGKPRAAFVISRQIQGTRLAQEIRDALESYGLHIFTHSTTQRVIYAHSATTGSTALDIEPESPAAAEIRAIVSELKEFVA